MIDIPRFIREFGPHILHVQAKDLMIDREGLYERGVFSTGIGCRCRDSRASARSMGRPVRGLYRAGYDGDIIIEHEEPRCSRHRRAREAGFLVARDVLRP